MAEEPSTITSANGQQEPADAQQAETGILGYSVVPPDDGEDSGAELLVCAACGFSIHGKDDYCSAAFGDDGKPISLNGSSAPIPPTVHVVYMHFHSDCFMSTPLANTMH